jgi:hypothetical protein
LECRATEDLQSICRRPKSILIKPYDTITHDTYAFPPRLSKESCLFPSLITHNTPLKLALLIRALEHVQNVAPPNQVVNLLGRKTALLEQALQPRELLLNVSSVRLALLSDLAVVLSILLLSTTNGLLKLLLRLGAARFQSAHDIVDRGDGAGESVETAAGDAEGAGFVVQERDEVGFAAAGGVGDCFGGAGRVVLDGRVGLDAGFLRGGFGVGGFAVDFGDEDVGLRGERGC